ncbi:MAG TPA: NUDIX domain-containing protein [Acidimicrobiia bacterium]|nr:NUDIX domain-containing protein [Acidimicrobiia bacterium]
MIRPASTLCLLRNAPAGMEVLMVRRASTSAFVGGAHVFPGGAVDDDDHSDLARQAVSGVEDTEMLPWAAAALREVAEEAGVLVMFTPDPALLGLHGSDLYEALIAAGGTLDGSRLAYLSNWVTPAGEPRRFDTRFFLAEVAPGTRARADEHEVTEATWITPVEALQRARRKEWFMIPPTALTLRTLARFETPDEAVAFARSQDQVPRIEPKRVVGENGSIQILMPGQAGYDDPSPR